MEDLEKRSEFWSSHYVISCQGPTDPRPFDKTPEWVGIYDDNLVLEIGPGEGRQADTLKHIAREYHVADISLDVLAQDRYSDCERHLIKDWSENLGHKYDVICFWYVLHHIKSDAEAYDFFNFLSAHTDRVHFNYPLHAPGTSHLSDEFTGDGIKTTFWNYRMVLKHLHGFFFEVVNEEYGVIEAARIW